MNYRSILLVTYGRSGSTLLQGVLNTIKGVTIRGENYDFCWGLYCAWKALSSAKADWSHRAGDATEAWFGADRLSPERFLANARQMVLGQLSPGDDCHCIGFKEIRYLDHLDEFFPYLQFLEKLFPKPAFIFNTREHSAVVRSAFWQKEDPTVLARRLKKADELFFDFASQKTNAFIMRYETLIKGAVAIAPLFDFLNVQPDADSIQKTLKTPHSFIPKPQSLNRAWMAQERNQAIPDTNRTTHDPFALEPESRLTATDSKVVVISVIRDEAEKLPWFIEYYRRLGCQAFIFIDNGSTDGSVEFLKQQPDVMVYHTPGDSFRGSHSGRGWVNALARKHALGKWVLCVDADELLAWPGDTHETLAGLVNRAERLGLNRVFTPMIDAYSDQPTNAMPAYQRGQPFGDVCPWVDPVKNTRFAWDRGRLVLYGGPRNRYAEPGSRPPITTKQTLYLVENDGYAHLGPHFDTYGIPSPLVAPLLHYKFMPDFSDRCEKDIREGNHWNNAQDYQNYKSQGLGTKCFKTEQSIRVFSGNDLKGHIQVISSVIQKAGLQGSMHVTHRFRQN